MVVLSANGRQVGLEVFLWSLGVCGGVPCLVFCFYGWSVVGIGELKSPQLFFRLLQAHGEGAGFHGPVPGDGPYEFVETLGFHRA